MTRGPTRGAKMAYLAEAEAINRLTKPDTSTKQIISTTGLAFMPWSSSAPLKDRMRPMLVLLK